MSDSVYECCVLGGTGFIGTALVKQLCRTGRIVKVVGRGKVPDKLPKDATYVRANLLDPKSLRGLFGSVTEVIDLVYGSVPKTSFDDPFADIQNNLPATLAVLEELARSNVERFIYVSSGGTVYGDASLLPINEDQPTRPISPYGVSKLASERYAELYRICRDVPSIVVRPSNAYGECQKGDVGQGFIATAIWGYLRKQSLTLYGERGTTRDYIHVNDIANAVIALLDGGVVGETYNIGTGVGTDNQNIIDLISTFAKDAYIEQPRIIRNPKRPFDVEANILDISKIKKATGWQPSIELEEGLRNCWDHMLKKYIVESRS